MEEAHIVVEPLDDYGNDFPHLADESPNVPDALKWTVATANQIQKIPAMHCSPLGVEDHSSRQYIVICLDNLD